MREPTAPRHPFAAVQQVAGHEREARARDRQRRPPRPKDQTGQPFGQQRAIAVIEQQIAVFPVRIIFLHARRWRMQRLRRHIVRRDRGVLEKLLRVDGLDQCAVFREDGQVERGMAVENAIAPAPPGDALIGLGLSQFAVVEDRRSYSDLFGRQMFFQHEQDRPQAVRRDANHVVPPVAALEVALQPEIEAAQNGAEERGVPGEPGSGEGIGGGQMVQVILEMPCRPPIGGAFVGIVHIRPGAVQKLACHECVEMGGRRVEADVCQPPLTVVGAERFEVGMGQFGRYFHGSVISARTMPARSCRAVTWTLWPACARTTHSILTRLSVGFDAQP